MNFFVGLSLAFLISSTADATLSVSESFTSSAAKDSSQMVWNHALGELHPPLRVVGYDRGSGAENYPFSVGDGRHGSFTTSSEFSALNCASVSGTLLQIDTDACNDLQFTRFQLPAGWTLRPIGSSPLRIRSLSYVTINGVIDCSGSAGQDGDADFGTSSAGGLGRCGGGAGGSSVLPGQAPGAAHQGAAGGAFVTGGSGGTIQDGAGGKGGGGGGAYVKNFAAPPDSPDGTSGVDAGAASVGNVGTNYRDDAFDDDLFGAGSGGGGGSGFQSGADPGNSSGGGGGAGGGTILIYAVGTVTVSATGAVLANGGNGGGTANPAKGGAGGGGGGGSILIMTVGDIINDGTISAVAGSGGAGFVGANGGNGYWGRTWIVEKDGFAGGLNIESPESRLNIPGDVRYETGVNYTVLSKALDLGNSRPTIQSAVATLVNPGGSTLLFEVAFGSSLTDPSLNNFALPATYVGAEVGRYGRFRIQLDNTSGTVPATITDVNFTFDGFLQNDFEFTGACGSINGGAGNAGVRHWPLSFFFLLLLPILLFGWLRSI